MNIISRSSDDHCACKLEPKEEMVLRWTERDEKGKKREHCHSSDYPEHQFLEPAGSCWGSSRDTCQSTHNRYAAGEVRAKEALQSMNQLVSVTQMLAFSGKYTVKLTHLYVFPGLKVLMSVCLINNTCKLGIWAASWCLCSENYPGGNILFYSANKWKLNLIK